MRAATALTWVILVSLLVLGFVRGNAFAYPAMLAALFGPLLVWDRHAYREILRRPWIWALVAGFGLFGLAMIANATTLRERFAFIDFLPLLLTVPASALFVRARIPNATQMLAGLALLGTAVAVAVCVFRGINGGFGRAAAWEISPIHFADLAMIAGFMALAGLMTTGSKWRWIYALGPVLGLLASVLAGTRSALVVGAVLFPVALFYLWRRTGLRLTGLLSVLGGLALLAAIAAGGAIAAGMGRTFEAATIVREMLTGQAVTDMSVVFRFDMYQAALQSIPREPFFGYGWTHQLQHILPYMSAAGQDEYQREHWGYVHNEVLSLIVGLGVPGAIGCLLLFAFPLVGLATTPKDSLSPVRGYLCLTVLIGIVISGVSDVLFMVELPKTFFCFIPAAILLLCRDHPGADPKSLGRVEGRPGAVDNLALPISH